MPDRASESKWLITGSLAIVAVVALAIALAYTRAVMIPFVLALFVASLVSPILDFQVIRLRLPRTIAVTVTMLVVIVIIALVVLLISEAIQTIISTAGRDSFASLAKTAFTRLEDLGMDLKPDKIVTDMRNSIFNLLTNTLGTVIGLISGVFFVLIFVIFLLAGRNPHVVRSGVYADIDQKIRRYIATKVAISVVTGLLVWLSLAIIGLELAGVFGMLAFLLNFIPNIGSVISSLLPIPIAVAQFQSFWPIILVLAIPGTIQMVLGNVVEPKLMGEGLDLHPIIVLLALSFWGLLWGIVGMFLAVPVTAVIRIVLMQFDSLKPIGKLLAGELPKIQEHKSS